MNVVKLKSSKAKGSPVFLSSQNPIGYPESERQLTVTFRFLAIAVSQTAAADEPLGIQCLPSAPVSHICEVYLHSSLQAQMSVLWIYSQYED